jgi:hypothetical protein
MKYCNVQVTPTRIPGGIMLVSKTPLRVFFATPAGVCECPRDAKTLEEAAKAGVLIDCNPRIVELAEAELVAAEELAKAELAKAEAEKKP